MTHHAQPKSGLALLFAPQTRPAADDIVALVAEATQAALSISHRPGPDDGWLEVLCRGLTFDVSGLAPGRADPAPAVRHRYGFAPDCALDAYEAVTVNVGQHLSGGDHLLPVVRAHVEVARALTALPGVRALVWCPADVAMSPQYFEQVMAVWAQGGPFPALGLTHVAQEPDGAVRSHGLAFFTGQDVRIEPMFGLNPPALHKIIISLIHRLVESGRLDAPCEMAGPDGEVLMVEPTDGGCLLRVRGKG